MNEHTPGAPPLWTRIAPGVFAVIATALALVGSWRASPTDDEPTFLGQGNYILADRDFRAPVLLWQPPLALYAQAAGLACVDLNRDAYEKARSVDSLTDLGDALIFESPARPETVLRAARLPIALATGLLAFLAAFLAQRLAGTMAMLVAGTLVSMSPALYGHGGLATTDLVATLASLVAVAATVRLVSAPDRRRGFRLELVVGAALGAALLAKHTSLVLVPVVLGVSIVAARRCGRTWPATVGRAALVPVAAAFVVWAGYGFDVGPLIDADSSGDLARKLAARVPLPAPLVEKLAHDLPVPAPRWFQSLVFQASKQHGRLYFRFLDDVSKVGWWTYFPVVALGKMTLGSLALCIVAVLTLRRRRPSADEWVLFLGFAVPFLAAVASRHNLGVRHVLPASAPLFVLAGVRIGRAFDGKPRTGFGVAVVCLLWSHAGEGFFAQRNPVAWWNVAYGGTHEGWRVSAGANADWGQGLWALRDYVREEGLTGVHLVAGGKQSAIDHLDEPRIEPMRGQWWTQRPVEGYLAVSTSAQWIDGKVPFTDEPPDAFVAGCYRLYRLPLK